MLKSGHVVCLIQIDTGQIIPCHGHAGLNAQCFKICVLSERHESTGLEHVSEVIMDSGQSLQITCTRKCKHRLGNQEVYVM
jgi:hypothetical protein